MNKNLSFGAKPSRAGPVAAATDDFVSSFAHAGRAGGKAPLDKPGVPTSEEDIARVTVAIPASLHRRFKAQAAQDGHKIADLVRAWVEQYLTKAQM